MHTSEEILKALSYVEDPDLNKDLVTLNMIQNLAISESNIAFDLVLTTPACPLKETIANACRNAIKTMVSDSINVEINITSKVQKSLQNNTVLTGVKNSIAIASGKGGVGKSTVAINIAKSLNAQGAKVGILDGDIHGPSIPVLLGVESSKPQMKEDKMVPIEVDGIKLMSIGFLIDQNQAVVWRGPMLSKAINQFCNDVLWGDLDYLIIDLPPGTGDIHLSIIQQVPLSGVVMVTTPEKVAVADTRKAIDMFNNPHLKQNILGVVENMSYFSPDELPENKYYLFGKNGGEELAKEFDLTFLGSIPIKEKKDFSSFEKDYAEITGSLAQILAIQASVI